MTILDENIPDCQYQLLRSKRVAVRQIGVDIGWYGMLDREIISLLHGLNRPTLFSLDKDFNKPELCHAGYGLVYCKVADDDVSHYVQLVLKHPHLNTRAKRMGTVVEVTSQRLIVWSVNAERAIILPWMKSPRRPPRRGTR